MSDRKEIEFENAIIKFGNLINKICFYFSDNPDEYQDIRQEIYFNIWKGWDRFNGDAKISTWIYRIAFNTCVSFGRKEKRSKELISIDNLVNIEAEEDYRLREKYNLMHRMISSLGYEDRVVIMMWLDEKTYEEIAEIMGLKRNTVAGRLKRIKEKLIKMSQNF